MARVTPVSWVEYNELDALFRLAFASGSTPKKCALTLLVGIHSPDHSTKGTTSHLDVLCVLVVTRFQVPPLPFFFTFPSQSFTIGHQEYLGFEGGPPFPPGFTCPVVLLDTACCFSPRIRDYHSLWWAVPCPLLGSNIHFVGVSLLPVMLHSCGFGLLRASLATTCMNLG